MSNLKEALRDAEALVAQLRRMLGIPPCTCYETVSDDVSSQKPTTKLSKRESEIYALLRQQKDLDEIASLLKISRKTVYVHRENIKQKLGIKTAKDLYRSIRNERSA